MTLGPGTGAGEDERRHRLAHDLMTPMRAIALYSEMLEAALAAEPFDADVVRRYGQRIGACATEATELVAELAGERSSDDLSSEQR